MIGQTGASVETELVEVGQQVIALDLMNDETDADLGDVRGGVVVAIESEVDRETGEVQRRFVCCKQYRRRIVWSTLTAKDVRQVLPFDSAAVRKLIRAMAADLGGRKGPMVTDDHRTIDAMQRLARVA